jgi:hypothetical protein
MKMNLFYALLFVTMIVCVTATPVDTQIQDIDTQHTGTIDKRWWGWGGWGYGGWGYGGWGYGWPYYGGWYGK